MLTAEIHAADILALDPNWPQDSNIHYHRLDQGDAAAVTDLFTRLGLELDPIIKDGSHQPVCQALCLRTGPPLSRWLCGSAAFDDPALRCRTNLYAKADSVTALLTRAWRRDAFGCATRPSQAAQARRVVSYRGRAGPRPHRPRAGSVRTR